MLFGVVVGAVGIVVVVVVGSVVVSGGGIDVVRCFVMVLLLLLLVSLSLVTIGRRLSHGNRLISFALWL